MRFFFPVCSWAHFADDCSSAAFPSGFYTLSSISGIMAWVVILASYLRFRAACIKQGVDRSKFPYQAPFQPYLSWFGMFFLILVVLFNGSSSLLTLKTDSPF